MTHPARGAPRGRALRRRAPRSRTATCGSRSRSSRTPALARGARLPRGGHRAAATASRSGRRTSRSGWSRRSALQTAGAVLVPINTRFKARRGRLRPAQERRAHALHGRRVPRHRLRRRRSRGEELPALERIVTLRGDARRRRRRGATSSPRGERVPSAHARERAPTPSRRDDLSDLLFTSGTTGNPKGVMTDARPEPARVRRRGAAASASARATATCREPVLPLVRLQGAAGSRACMRGATCIPHAGLRRGGGARADRARAHHACCPGRRRSTSRCSRTRSARSTTSRRCASP